MNQPRADSSRETSLGNPKTNYGNGTMYNKIFGSLTSLLLLNYKSTLEIGSSSSDGGLSLPAASMHLAQSIADVLDLMKLGEKNRAFGSTAMNKRSSRSHNVLTVHVHGQDISDSTTSSCLHLVDLAGSERVDNYETTGDRLKDAQCINKSLSCLGDVITGLAQKNPHIPYRNSMLTQLLQNSLGGNAKILMFAHVSPEADSYGETISTLKFARRASTVEPGAAQLNTESSEIRELKEQVWVWDRFPYIAPHRLLQPPIDPIMDLAGGGALPAGPLAMMWRDAVEVTKVFTHILLSYQHHLDRLRFEQSDSLARIHRLAHPDSLFTSGQLIQDICTSGLHAVRQHARISIDIYDHGCGIAGLLLHLSASLAIKSTYIT
ncbi:kinesin-like protein KIN-14L [Elaeis guineensis]|uniref:kinesin-like protein KIN-14L n=1 Tax=Elaeis guineensis var. tenera TaxID=51953 RepID=UPI003C6CFD73